MAKQTPDHWAPGRSLRWRLAGLTLAVLALHALALVWWLDGGDRPAIVPEATAPPPSTTTATVGPVQVPSPTIPAPAAVVVATANHPPAAVPTPTSERRSATAPVNLSQKIQTKLPPAHTSKVFSAPVSELSDDTAPTPPSAAMNVVGQLPADATPATSHAPPLAAAPHPGDNDTDDPPATPGSAPPLLAVVQTRTTASARGTAPVTVAERATVARHIAVPASRTLEFRVRASRKGLTLPADSTLTWEHRGSSYSASMLFKAMLGRSRSQTSVGAIDPVLGLQPRRFGDKNRSEVATHFDRSRQPPAIRFSNNAPDQPLLPHTQDRLSVLIQLAAMVAGEPQRYPPGQAVVLHTVSSRDADLWRFVVKNTEVLDLPVGAMDTVHLVREALHAYDNRVEVWLAPQLGYLPVRILWTQANGDVVDQQLSAHRP